jgi:hypothetical protein
VASGPKSELLLLPAGGSLSGDNGQVAVGATTGSGQPAPALLDLVPVAVGSLPPPPQGFSFAGTAFQITLTNPATGQADHDLTNPFVLTVHLTSADAASAGGDASKLALAFWNGSAWVGVPCSMDSGSLTLTCTLSHLTLFAVLVTPPVTAPAELDLPNGQFFTRTNGFSGASADWTGFSVVDDAQANFFTEWQNYGGAERVGLPISGRFMHAGFLTQAFQKLVLQWRPELGRAVPLNTFDDLNQRGSDGWLDVYRQVPPAADTSADVGLPFDQVVARHTAMLDAYPPLRDFYTADDNRLEDYGLPLAVKDYGTFVAVRLQRAAFQLWKVDVPWAAAGTVVVANGGDLAKEAGLIDPAAVVPAAW